MKNPFARKPRSNYDSYNDSYDGGFYRGEEPEDGIVGDFEEDENFFTAYYKFYI